MRKQLHEQLALGQCLCLLCGGSGADGQVSPRKALPVNQTVQPEPFLNEMMLQKKRETVCLSKTYLVLIIMALHLFIGT